MRFPKLASLLLASAAATILFSATTQGASAQTSSLLQKTYKVQVEYWFFDTDYTYWSTVFETNDLQEALFVYELLLIAKENHQLNEVAANSYGRYIAIDVRMITEYHYRELYKPWYSDLDLTIKK